MSGAGWYRRCVIAETGLRSIPTAAACVLAPAMSWESGACPVGQCDPTHHRGPPSLRGLVSLVRLFPAMQSGRCHESCLPCQPCGSRCHATASAVVWHVRHRPIADSSSARLMPRAGFAWLPSGIRARLHTLCTQRCHCRCWGRPRARLAIARATIATEARQLQVQACVAGYHILPMCNAGRAGPSR